MKSSMQVKQALPVECRKKGGKEVMHELLRDLKAFLEEMGVELTLRTAADIPLINP
ncbi:Cell morphogenesis protein [Venturia inaequalis]|nr:Cell morphogenesis protein [Venturia inaequalis]